MSRDDKIPMPKIPGRVYNVRFMDKYGLFYIYPLLIICLVMLGMFTDVSQDKISLLFIICSIGFIVDFKKRFSVRFIDFAEISETQVRAKFGNGKDIHDDLENYRLLIGTGINYRASKHYKYGVYLLKNESSNENTRITLAETILCPIKLKEWVESFQSQIAKPLPIIFSSPEIESDYNTGVYMSLKKKKPSAL